MGEVYAFAEIVLIWLGQDSRFVAQTVLDAIRDLFKDRPVPHQKLEDVRHIVRQIGQTEWFSRLWVVQELLLSRSAYFFWGDEVLPFEYLEAFLVLSGDKHYRWMTHKKTGMFREIWETLDDYCKLQCSDKRDHIYAILGLLYSDTNYPARAFYRVQPYYEKTWQQLHFEVACMYINTENLDSLLAYVNHVGEPNKAGTGLPTWIPVWSCLA